MSPEGLSLQTSLQFRAVPLGAVYCHSLTATYLVPKALFSDATRSRNRLK